MCCLGLLPTDAMISVVSFLIFDDVLHLAACSRPLLTEHRLGRRVLTVTWRHPSEKEKEFHGHFGNLEAFASLLRRQHRVESLTLRVQTSAPTQLAGAGTATPMRMDELLADPMEVIHDTKSGGSMRAILPSSIPPVVLPVLPSLTSLHVRPAVVRSRPDAPLPSPAPTFLPLSSSSSSSTSSYSSSSLAMAATAHLLGSLLHPSKDVCVPRLHTLCLHTRDILDDQGMQYLARGFDEQQQTSDDCPHMHEDDVNYSCSSSSSPFSSPSFSSSSPRTSCALCFRRLSRTAHVNLSTLVLEPPRLSQGRGLSRFLLSGPFHLVRHLTLRHVSGQGTTALRRFLTLSHAPRLETLRLLRCDGQLAWGDPVAEALALPHVAPCLRVLEAAFLPFGTKAAHALIARRFHHGQRLGCSSCAPSPFVSSSSASLPSSSSSSPSCSSSSSSSSLFSSSPPAMTVLRLWAAGLGYRDISLLLDIPPSLSVPLPSFLLPAPLLRQHHHLQDLRVLCINFHSSHGVAALLPAALAKGACPRLEELSLVQCRLDDAFSVALAAVLVSGAGRTTHSASAATAAVVCAAAAGCGRMGSTGNIRLDPAAVAPAENAAAELATAAAEGGAACATTLQTLDLAFNAVGSAGLQALLEFVMFAPGCGLRRLRLDGNALGGMEAVLLLGRTLLGQQPPRVPQQQQHVPCLRRLEMLELRRVRVWKEKEDALQAQEAVILLVKALLRPGRAPALRQLVLGVEAMRGMNVEGQEGKGRGGYLPPGTMNKIQALLGRHRQEYWQHHPLGEEEGRRVEGEKWVGGTRLEVTAEGGSPFMGLGF